jgi:PHD/YefM family antitoxin component YafN of YafNO toxin-antitoxin module
MEVTMREETLSIAELQKEIPQLPEQFEKDLLMVTVTRSDEPVMFIIAPHAFKAWMTYIEKLAAKADGLVETMEILQDEETMAALRQGIKEMEEGKGKLLDDVLKELGWE